MGATPAGITRESAGRLLVRVRVTPRAAAADELILDGEILRARVHAPPVEGAANAALCALFAARLRIPRRAIHVERGARSRDKVIAMTGLTAVEFWRRLGRQHAWNTPFRRARQKVVPDSVLAASVSSVLKISL